MEKQKELRDININNFKQYQLGIFFVIFLMKFIHSDLKEEEISIH
jgi:hypothetical protein